MLDYIAKGKQPLIQRGALENLTPAKALEQGLYICYECGQVNCIDSTHYKDCGEERFIITVASGKPVMVYERPLPVERPDDIRYFLYKLHADINADEIVIPVPNHKPRKHETISIKKKIGRPRKVKAH